MTVKKPRVPRHLLQPLPLRLTPMRMPEPVHPDEGMKTDVEPPKRPATVSDNSKRLEQAAGVTVEDDDIDGFEKYDNSAWFAAIRTADTWRDATKPGRKKPGNLGRLVDLLRARLVDAHAEVTMTREECEVLIDLLARHKLQQKAGGRKVPAYKRASWAELKLEIAAESVRYYQSVGLSFDAAVERTLRHAYVGESALKLHLQGRLGSTRRRKAVPKTK